MTVAKKLTTDEQIINITINLPQKYFKILSKNSIVLLGYIQSLSKKYYFCWMEDQTLANNLDISIKTIRRCLDELKDNNLIYNRRIGRKRHIVHYAFIDKYIKTYPKDMYKTDTDFMNYIINSKSHRGIFTNTNNNICIDKNYIKKVGFGFFD